MSLDLTENEALKTRLAKDLLKLMFPNEDISRWNVEVTESSILYCGGDHDKSEDCVYDRIDIYKKATERFRHKKRGTHYNKQAVGILQIEPGVILKDGDELVVYTGEEDGGKYWLRTPDEFYDGRFEQIKVSSQPMVEEKKPDTFLNRLLKEERKKVLINQNNAVHNGSYQGDIQSDSTLKFLDRIEAAIELDGGIPTSDKLKDPKEIRNRKIKAMWNAHRHFISPFQTYEGEIPKERKDLKLLYEGLLTASETVDNFYSFDKNLVQKIYPDEVFDRMTAQVDYVLKRFNNLDLGEDVKTLTENCVANILRYASDFTETSEIS
jgi:hypothetical protein